MFLCNQGNSNINVIDLTDATNPVVLHHTSYAGIHVTDVALCGDYVYTINVPNDNPDDGYVNLYRAYDKQTDTLELVGTVKGMWYCNI